MLTPLHTVLTRRQARAAAQAATAYRQALRAEYRAADADAPEATMWRLAAASDRALRLYELALAGQTPPVPRTRRNLALGAFLALATVGRVVARALAREARNARRRVAAALARAARKVARTARAALRRTLRTVAALVAVVAPRAAVRCVRCALLAALVTTPRVAPASSVVSLTHARAGPLSDPIATLRTSPRFHNVTPSQDTPPMAQLATTVATAPAVVPATIHGYPVVASRRRSFAAGFVILVRKPTEWVTAVWLAGDGWDWGHYTSDEARAVEDFWTR